MMRQLINTGKKWEQASAFGLGNVVEGKLLFTAGITARDEDGVVRSGGDVGAQFTKCFENVTDILKAAGVGWSDVVKITMYTTDMDQAVKHKGIWEGYLKNRPCSTLVGVAQLMLPEMKVEMEVVALLK